MTSRLRCLAQQLRPSSVGFASLAKPSITLYTAGTPNGHKLSILLEELGIQYEVIPISLQKNEQKAESYLQINPNGRIPGIVDTQSPFGEYALMESGAQMLYLTDVYDTSRKVSFVHGSKDAYDALQWLFFTNAGVGPMQGQANHFHVFAPEKIPYAITRYQNETRRLYAVLDGRLHDRQWLAGDRFSIADIATYAWVRGAEFAGIDNVRKFENVFKWKERVAARDAVQRGIRVPAK